MVRSSIAIVVVMAGLFCQLGKSQVLMTARYQGKYGLLDTAGKWFLEPKYDSLGTFYSRSVPYHVNGKWGLLSPSGAIISPALWSDISTEKEGLISVFDGNYWGYIDTKGKTVIEPQFLEADDFSEGLAGASKIDEIWGYIDTTGRWVIPPAYDFVLEFEGGKSMVVENDQMFYIDRTGKPILPEPGKITYTRFWNEEETALGILRSDGTELFPPRFENLSLRSGNLYFYYENEKWGLIDTSGAVIRSPEFSDFQFFKEGLAAVQLNGKWGYINRRGELVIPCIFDEAGYFSFDRAAVRFGDKWGCIGKDGSFLIAPKYDVLLGQFVPSDIRRLSKMEIDLF